MAIWNERIHEKRLEKGITLAQVADKLGVAEATAQRYESGNIKNVPYDHMCAYGELLGCSPAYLMGWENEEGYTLYGKLMSMPKDEIELVHVNSYESLIINEMKKINKKGKVRLLDTVREMTCNPLYNDNYHLEVRAAHERTDIEVTDEMRKHDDDIMSDENF